MRSDRCQVAWACLRCSCPHLPLEMKFCRDSCKCLTSQTVRGICSNSWRLWFCSVKSLLGSSGHASFLFFRARQRGVGRLHHDFVRYPDCIRRKSSGASSWSFKAILVHRDFYFQALSRPECCLQPAPVTRSSLGINLQHRQREECDRELSYHGHVHKHDHQPRKAE